ncbi:MAG TPA: condensation domain-containing protein, partial [Thermoanaerobaculia bacterium]
LLGRPLPGAVLHVCDGYGDLLPPGVAGELWIGGPGVSRGYLGRRELTADKYVPCGGGRLYRSGDRVRCLADGSLEFLGRLDHQIKVRGVRIEPGEIEAALEALSGVREAAVGVRGDTPEGRRLVAWVVGDVAADALRRSLRERLPDSMMPALFVTLPALPRSPNGKVDRAALPAPDAARPDAAREHVAPRTREEEILATIWAQVLGLSRVGMTDNFFELGGDSILSIQIVARARQAGLHLTVRQMFEHQTVAGLALHATATSGATLAEQGPVTGEIPLTPVQRSFFEQGFADLHHFNQALVLEPREPLVPAALEHAVAAVVEHHDALRLRFGRHDHPEGKAGWRQENAAAEPVPPFLRIDLSSLPASRFHEAFEGAATALQGGFDLATGPLTRLALCEAGAGLPGLLLWMAHHLVVDGVSWRIVLEDLDTAYGQLRAGRAVLSAADTEALLHRVHDAYQTSVDDLLRTALVRAFGRVTGRRSLLVDLEGHGREDLFPDLDLSRTVGWFTALYRVRLDLGGAAGVGEELRAVKEQGRRIPAGGVGYGLLRYAAGDPETAARLREPRAEVLFNYLGQLGLLEAGTFAPVAEPVSATLDPGGRRSHRWVVNCWVAAGRLESEWSYSKNLEESAEIRRLADAFIAELRALIDHCLKPGAGGYSASDFPEAELSEKELHKLMTKLGRNARGSVR